MKTKVTSALQCTVIVALGLVAAVVAIAAGARFGSSEQAASIATSISGGVSQPVAVSAPISTPAIVPVIAKILFTGDIMLADYVGREMDRNPEFNPFRVSTVRHFAKYDLVVSNLETNISRPGVGKPAQGKSYRFNAPLRSLKLIKDSGVDLVSLANNHTMDFGGAGLLDQIKLLDQNKIKHFGAGSNRDSAFSPKYITVNGQKIAFLGFNDAENKWADAGANTPGSAYLRKGSENLVRDAIAQAKKNSKFVVVLPHWGTEQRSQPNADQRYWADVITKAGADLVIGAHAHIIQPREMINGKIVYFGLGNFIGGGYATGPSSKGLMVEIQLKDYKIINEKTFDVQIDYHGTGKILS